MVKCEVAGDRLDLEFIVTGGAQFKVSAAALGLSAANACTMPSSSTNSSSISRLPSKPDEQADELDAAAAADVLPADTPGAADSGLGSRSGSGGGGSQQQQAASSGKQTALTSPRSSSSSPAMLSGSLPDAEHLGAEGQASAEGDAAPGSPGCQDKQAKVAAAVMAGSSGLGSSTDPESAPAGGLGTAALLDDSAYHGSGRSFDGLASSAPAPTTLGSRRLARIISRYGSNSGSGNSGTFAVGSPPGATNGVSQSAAAGATGRSFVRGLGSRALSSGDDGSRSSIRPVKTDDGEYLVWVESFSLTFRCVQSQLGGSYSWMVVGE